MPDWTTYADSARARGALALELFMVHSVPVPGGPAVPDVLPDHLAYQSKLESQGSLFLAGPLSDDTGRQITGAGLVILRASTLDHARQLADADPMHASGARSYTLRRWLVNEGSLSLSVGLSTAAIALT